MSTQGWNRYSYCHNNPVRYRDPTGHGILDDAGSWLHEKTQGMSNALQSFGNSLHDTTNSIKDTVSEASNAIKDEVKECMQFAKDNNIDRLSPNIANKGSSKLKGYNFCGLKGEAAAMVPGMSAGKAYTSGVISPSSLNGDLINDSVEIISSTSKTGFGSPVEGFTKKDNPQFSMGNELGIQWSFGSGNFLTKDDAKKALAGESEDISLLFFSVSWTKDKIKAPEYQDGSFDSGRWIQFDINIPITGLNTGSIGYGVTNTTIEHDSDSVKKTNE